MITVDLNDKHLATNIKTIRELQKLGFYTDEELQRLYDRQLEIDKRSECE